MGDEEIDRMVMSMITGQRVRRDIPDAGGLQRLLWHRLLDAPQEVDAVYRGCTTPPCSAASRTT